MFKLRCYQDKLKNAIYSAWEVVRCVLAVLATGGGKTVIFSAVMNEHNGASAAVVHRKEIVSQISCALAKLGVRHRVVAPPNVVANIRRKHLKLYDKSFIDPQALVGVVSVQTLTSKASSKNRELQSWIAQVTLAVFDEGHHYVKSGLWAKAVELMTHAKILFVTATPERADGKGLGAHAEGFAEAMVEGPSARWLVKNGYLCGFKYFTPDSDLNLDNIPLTAKGDLNTNVMRKRIVESELVGDVVNHYRRWAGGKKAIVFANDVETACDMVAAFKDAGINAAELNGGTDSGVRDKTLEAFEFGKLMVLINVDLFDEGFDVAGVECVIMARKTESLAKFLQMIGRALRVIYGKGFDLQTAEGRLAAIAASSKPFAAIIDPVRNWERHGMPNWPRMWSLDGRGDGGGGSDTAPQRICLGCTMPYLKALKVCPYPECGEPAPVPGTAERSTPAQVGGELQELDVEALAQIFEDIEKANMSDEDFKGDMIARKVPSIGRGRQLKSHQNNKYRRQVLKELIAWWVGMQPGREMAEIQRRFYYRFDIDMGNALTLKAKDTDALIGKIERKFSEDMYDI